MGQGGGGGGGFGLDRWEQRSEACLKIKKKIFFFFFFGGGGRVEGFRVGGVRVDVNGEVKLL